MSSRLVPQIIPCLKEGIDGRTIGREAMAGVIVGVVALPLAIAFAIASGVKPEQGLFTAVVAGFIISALSGSRVQIGGPTGAFIVVVFSIVSRYGYSGLAAATIMAGLLLVAMGFARLGSVIKFIPYPMTIGFTGGIALIIAATQLKDFFGLAIAKPAGEFPAKILQYIQYAGTFNRSALLVALLSLTVIILWPKVTTKIPGSLVAIIAATAVVRLLDLPVATIGSQFGSVPSLLPAPSLPRVDLSMLPQLISPAFTIAMLAAIESLLSAVVADGMTGSRHRSNMELIAQGMANIVSPLFGGIPATGAIARTATNVKNGGRTPLAGMIHAVTLLLILLFFGRWAVLIPMPTLAAILLVVSYHMSEWRHFVKLLKAPRTDVLVMLSTFSLTVLVDLTVAIEVGIVLSALLFMQRMAEATEIRSITSELAEEWEEGSETEAPRFAAGALPAEMEVFEVHGPFFFGAATQFRDTMSKIETPPKVLVLHMEHIFTMDATALHVLEDLFAKAQKEKTALILSGVRARAMIALRQSGLLERIGRKRVFLSLEKALEAGRRIIDGREKSPGKDRHLPRYTGLRETHV